MSRALNIGVVGGGLVGAATALGLARKGFAVTLIDRAEPRVERSRLGADIRNVALNPRSRMLLEDLDVWPDQSAVPYRKMHVWEERGSASLEFCAWEVGRTELGWLVEMSPLLCGIWDALADTVALNFSVVEGISKSAHGVTLGLEGGQALDFDFLIASDGGQSRVRQDMGFKLSERPVDQLALATVVRLNGTHESTAWQRFLVDGPLALLPSTRPDLASIVWSGPRTKTHARLQLSDEDFCAEITRLSESRLGEVVAVDRRVAFPLTQQYAPQPFRDNVLLIGDAAHVVHPLAGLGVNLGFEDVGAVLAIAGSGANLSRPSTWRSFVRARTLRARSMIRLLGSLNALYGAKDPGVGLLRNLGMRWVNRAGPLKHQIMREAMGIGHL
jgi:ubiquinone biosynthesis UbiH/UbiF/VisC/COQ6 family hydroxylase